MKQYFPVLAILLACVIWGMNGIFVNTLDLPTSQQTFFRLLVPTVITGLIIIFTLKKDVKNVRFTTRDILTISGANALRMYLLNLGFIMTTIGNAVIAQRSNAILIIILAAIFLHEKVTKTKIISLVIGFAGLIIIAAEKGISLENKNFLGILAIMGAATISSYLNIQYKQKIHHIGSTQTIFLQSFLGVIVFGAFSFFAYPLPDLGKIGLALVHSFVIGVIGFYLYFWSLRYMEVSKITILTFSEIIFGVIFGYIFLHQIPSIYTYGGMLCIVISGIILALKKTRT